MSTALRMIISEHLDTAEADADLNAAMRWQREQAWKALDRLEKGQAKRLTIDDLREAHAKAIRRHQR